MCGSGKEVRLRAEGGGADNRHGAGSVADRCRVGQDGEGGRACHAGSQDSLGLL